MAIDAGEAEEGPIVQDSSITPEFLCNPMVQAAGDANFQISRSLWSQAQELREVHLGPCPSLRMIEFWH